MMTVKDIWKVSDGAVVNIGGREYVYSDRDGRRLVTDMVIGDEHDVSDWFGEDEEIVWVRVQPQELD